MKQFFTSAAVLMSIALGFALIAISQSPVSRPEALQQGLTAIAVYLALFIPCVFCAGVIDRLDQLIELGQRQQRRDAKS